MSKSILEPKDTRNCYVCGSMGYLEDHHIFHGTANRKKSERWGLKVHLCHRHHRDAKEGVHGLNTELDIRLKKEGQQEFERLYGHEKFMEEFGKNYIDKLVTEPEKGPGREPEKETGKRPGQQVAGFWFLEEEDDGGF